MILVHTLESTDISQGGPARSVPQLARSLRRPGNQISLYANAKKPTAGKEDEAISLIPMVGYGGDFRSFLEKMGEITLVHDHGLWQPFHRTIADACSKQKIMRVVSPRGMLEPWSLNHKKWKKKIAWYLYQRRDLNSANALHATAKSEAEQFRKLGFRQPIILLPNGIMLPDRTNDPNQASRLAGGGNRQAIFLGRVHPKKGLPLLIQAWKELRPEGWRMRVIGPDEANHREELLKQVEAAGLQDTWTFDGAVDGSGKWNALHSSDLFILPTHSENFGIAVAEALGCGVPVITTHGAPWQVLEERNCGWWVPINAESLREAMKDAMSRSSEELLAMGERGRKVVEERFSWGKISEDMLSSYSWLLNGGEKPPCVSTI